MLGDITRLLIEVLFTLFGATLVLRFWIQAVRLQPYNPLSQGVMQITNWLVMPLRRMIPGVRGYDWATAVAAWLAALVYVSLLSMSFGLSPRSLLAAVFTVLLWSAKLVFWLTLLSAILSWINPSAPVMGALHTLLGPFLNPIRRILPQAGGLDFSPIVLLVLMQIVQIVLGYLSIAAVGLRI
ncbi:MAG: YggT family protein [Candidatus Protistobacter heckmanni]|nr:YggT family protein [Candidatus Protistobacter heckmanni]